MKNILTIGKLIFLLNARRGTVWGVIFLIVGISTFIFWASSGDNVLINELQLRLQYSFALTYSLLTLIVISLSCYTVRFQIDQKQIHMLTSFPISRKEIWLGKWLGVMSIASVAEAVLFLSLVTSAYFFSRPFPPEEIRAARDFFGIIKYEARPNQISARKLTETRIEQLIQEKKVAFYEVNDDFRRKIFEHIRKEQQLIPPQGEKTWQFDLKKKPEYGDYIELKFKFYTESRRKRILGNWSISMPSHAESFTSDFKVFPYTFNTVTIPLSHIPETGKFNVTLKSHHPSDVIVNKKVGLKIYYEDGPLVQNIFKAFVLQIIHLAVTTSVGLTAGVAFTFSVATFLSFVLYFLSVSSGFFSGIVRDLTSGYQTSFLDQISVYIINAGMWLAKGLQPPEIIASLSSGITISIEQLLVNWISSIFLYGIVVTLIGIYLLTQKELDNRL